MAIILQPLGENGQVQAAAPPTNEHNTVISHESVKNMAVAQNQYGFVFKPGGVTSAICSWLNAPDPRSEYFDALDKRQKGVESGRWFIESDSFDSWKTSPNSFLWLHGIAGSGKTVLSAAIIDSIHELCTRSSASASCFFFFKFDDGRKCRYEYMARSLVLQLALLCESIPKSLETLHKLCMLWKRPPNAKELLEVAVQIVDEFAHVYLIVDALDECSDLRELLNALEMVSKWQNSKLHVLVTSRMEKDIYDLMDRVTAVGNHINLQTDLVSKDIKDFVDKMLEEDRGLKRWKKNVTAQELIRTSLVSKSNGMFRWVACQLDELRNCYDFDRLQSTLRTLPQSLEGTYARILRNIPMTYKSDALKLLQCLVVSARPFSLDEVVEIVAVHLDKKPRFSIAHRFPDPEDILKLCSSLVTIVMEHSFLNDQRHVRKVIRLAHFSVQEYLVSDSIAFGEASFYSICPITANATLAQICIAYLLQFTDPEDPPPLASDDYPLVEYAAQYWTRHAAASEQIVTSHDNSLEAGDLTYFQSVSQYFQDCAFFRHLALWFSRLISKAQPVPTSLTASLSMELLLSAGPYLNWLRIWDPDQPEKISNSLRSEADVASPLYYASLTGLLTSVKLLLEKNLDVNTECGRYGFPLIAASLGGHYQISLLLLRYGAKVNACGGECGNALYAAADHGHLQTVRLLLDKGADTNLRGGGNGTALPTAAEKGHKAVVELLLERGVDINARDGRCGDALQAAVAEGHEEVARLLIDKGANVHAHGGVYRNTVLAAVWPGHGKLLQLLLDKGVNINEVDKFYSNALYGAAFQGNKSMVKELLDKDADITLQGDGYGTPLYAAALNGFEQVARLLLEHGMSVNQEGGYYGTPLQAAARNGDENMVRLLLNYHANIDQESGFYGTALFASYDNGHKAVADLLQQERIKKGLQKTIETAPEMLTKEEIGAALRSLSDDKVSPQDERYNDLLQAAVYQGDEATVRQLVNRGMPVNNQGRGLGKPLYTASARGHEAIVQLLVVAGAEIDAQGKGFGNALQAAANNGHTSIVQYLVEQGANVNARCGLHETALHASAYESHKEIVQILIKHGANVNAADRRWGTTVLQAACWGGSEDVVKLLLVNGAVVDAPGGAWGSATQAARLRRHDVVLDLLKSYMPM